MAEHRDTISSVPFFFEDFNSGTSDMPAEHLGVYIRLLSLFWTRGGKLRDDDRELAMKCNISTRKFRQIKAELVGGDRAKFQIVDNLYRQKRAEKSYLSAIKNRELAVEKGRKGGKTRAKNKQQPQNTADQGKAGLQAGQSSRAAFAASSILNHSKKETNNKHRDSTPATAPGSNNVGGEVDLKFLCNEVLRLTGLDQRPAPVATGAIDMWLNTGLSPDQIITIVAEHTERKRNNGETISSLNYFRDIMTKAAVDAFDQGRRHDAREGALGQRVADMSEITWRSAVTKYGETGNWSRGGWGEPPGHPDCMVPNAIKAEFTDLFKAEGVAI